ncbi:GapA-binding peptide SR1P [Aneurinibacillus soli]|nr:GapA-binding peptide SR1P [Aneurinibacillus soli]
MGTIICQHCDTIIEHYETEKVEVLYANTCDCSSCGEQK